MKTNPHQPQLRFVGAPYTPGSETSKAAAYDVACSLKEKQKLVYDYLKEAGPQSDQELCEHFMSVHNWGESTARTRRCELVDEGLVQKSTCQQFKNGMWHLVEGCIKCKPKKGKPKYPHSAKRVTPKGKHAQVWEIKA